jgi:hypothetical protein
MKKTIMLALAVALLGGAAYANFGARDTVPSATLLVPYIVVDADAHGIPSTIGYTTLTVVTNVSSAKQIIHVSVFNAASEAVIDFDEVLSGYDVWSINWRDLVTGDFENFDTGSATNPVGATTPYGLKGFWNAGSTSDKQDANAPQPWGPTENNKPTFTGLVAPWDIDNTTPATGTSCGFPWGNQSVYAGLIVSGLQSPLVSWPSQDTNCTPLDGAEIPAWGGWLSSLGTQPLFFYALIDSVQSCNGFFPGDNSFWTGNAGGSYLSNTNVLTGYDFYMNPTQNYSESLPTVNLEASAAWGNAGNVSFYTANRVAAMGTSYTTTDPTAREPLPTAWAFNYFQNGGATTQVAVWKNYDDFETGKGYNYVAACRPYIYYAFDESENSKASTTPNCPSGTFCLQPEPNVFPFQTQMVKVNLTNFDGLMSGNGWMLLVFDPSIPYVTVAYDKPADLMTYVFAKYNFGTYSTSVEATVMSNPYIFPAQLMPNLNTYNGTTTNYYGPVAQ